MVSLTQKRIQRFRLGEKSPSEINDSVWLCLIKIVSWVLPFMYAYAVPSHRLQVSRKLEVRKLWISNHVLLLSSLEASLKKQTVGEHFNLPGHSIADLRMGILREASKGDFNVRLLNLCSVTNSEQWISQG
ncbi:UNVERIFIED_CONTAM: hypothetical protein K2H54_063190 [Gekko kuhli]